MEAKEKRILRKRRMDNIVLTSEHEFLVHLGFIVSSEGKKNLPYSMVKQKGPGVPETMQIWWGQFQPLYSTSNVNSQEVGINLPQWQYGKG